MSLAQERNQILQMIEENTISAEEGLALLNALEASADEGPAQGEPGEREDPTASLNIEKLRSVKRWWTIPLFLGLGLTLLGVWLMYSAMQTHGIGILFILSWIPFLLGIGTTTFAWGSRTSPWLHLRVQQKPGSHPRRIAFSFPIPIRLTAWFVRTFGEWIPELEATGLDEVLIALQESAQDDMPLIVDVDEGDNGERVRVIIG